MIGKTCLDSGVVIALLRGDSDIGEKIDGLLSPVLTSFALAEAIFGAKLSRQKEANRRVIDLFAAGCIVMYLDANTLESYADLKVQLRVRGTPIPENDIWIAALCLQHDLELAFRDKYFDFIPGLKKLHWKKVT